MSVPPSADPDVPPPPGGQWPPPPAGLSPESGGFSISQDDRTMAMLAHILPIFTGFLGPLIIWLIKKDQSKFVAYHGMQALFFQIAVAVLYIASFVLMMVSFGLLFFVPLAVWVISLVFHILAGMAANRGELYELPVVGKMARQQVGI